MWVVYSGEVRGEVGMRSLPTTLLSFSIYQPDDGQCKVPKHVVVLHVINSIHISTII